MNITAKDILATFKEGYPNHKITYDRKRHEFHTSQTDYNVYATFKDGTGTTVELMTMMLAVEDVREPALDTINLETRLFDGPYYYFNKPIIDDDFKVFVPYLSVEENQELFGVDVSKWEFETHDTSGVTEVTPEKVLELVKQFHKENQPQ